MSMFNTNWLRELSLAFATVLTVALFSTANASATPITFTAPAVVNDMPMGAGHTINLTPSSTAGTIGGNVNFTFNITQADVNPALFSFALRHTSADNTITVHNFNGFIGTQTITTDVFNGLLASGEWTLSYSWTGGGDEWEQISFTTEGTAHAVNAPAAPEPMGLALLGLIAVGYVAHRRKHSS